MELPLMDFGKRAILEKCFFFLLLFTKVSEISLLQWTGSLLVLEHNCEHDQWVLILLFTAQPQKHATMPYRICHLSKNIHLYIYFCVYMFIDLTVEWVNMLILSVSDFHININLFFAATQISKARQGWNWQAKWMLTRQKKCLMPPSASHTAAQSFSVWTENNGNEA